jgi:hypothetical protein
MAEENAVMKRNTDMTSERMFFGAFVNAYSSPVIEAKISLMAIRMYLGAQANLVSRKVHYVGNDLRPALNPDVERGNNGLFGTILTRRCRRAAFVGLNFVSICHRKDQRLTNGNAYL